MACPPFPGLCLGGRPAEGPQTRPGAPGSPRRHPEPVGDRPLDSGLFGTADLGGDVEARQEASSVALLGPADGLELLLRP
eukprot:13540519-Alexandrium_andersonii.AAC.1